MASLGATTDAFESHADAKLLDAAECAALVAYADARAPPGAHDLKLDLTRDGLAACVGDAAASRLLAFAGGPALAPAGPCSAAPSRSAPASRPASSSTSTST